MPRRLSLASVVRVFRPLPSVSSHLDEMQHTPVNDPARQRFE